MKRSLCFLLIAVCALYLCSLSLTALADSAAFRADAQQLFSALSKTALTASSGAGAWEGKLNISADGSFTGDYEDADADMIYQVSFSGRFNWNVEAHGHTYWLWVEELTARQAPGTRGVDQYGDPVTYIDPPISAREYMVLTLPGTPDSEIPEMVKGEIGGTLDEWNDFSRFITLTRQNDGWGFFAESDASFAYAPEPLPDGDDEQIDIDWTGIWVDKHHANNRLYVYRKAGGSVEEYQTIQTMEKNGKAVAFQGGLYPVDEITVEYYSEGLLYAGIVQVPFDRTLSLTVFSALNDGMLPWVEILNSEYEYIGPLNDPDSQIDPALWDLVRIGLEPADDPASEPDAGPTEAPAALNLSAWTGYWMTRDGSLAEMIVTDMGNGALRAQAMFLPAGDFEAVLTPQGDGSMRFEAQYGSLAGRAELWQDGGLRLSMTGGSLMEDEEATEYQGYFAPGFTYYPAAYAEMWYQLPGEAAATPDDWAGAWKMMGGAGDSRLFIQRESGGMRVDVSLGGYHFSGIGELTGDSTMDLYADDFSCMLLLNKKLNRIAMLEVGSDIEGVYSYVSGPYYGVVLYQREGDSADAPGDLPRSGSMPFDIMPVPTAPGVTQTIVHLPVPTPSPDSGRDEGLLPIPGKRGYLEVPISRADATSYIVSSKDPAAYAPFRMTDRQETTSFQFSTKTTPLGQAYLFFEFDGPVKLDEMWMKNGFWKITQGLDQYTRNSRVKEMTIEVRYAGESGYKTLKTVSLKDDKARKDWKVIDMLGVRNVTAVRIRVDAIYKGTKFPTDVCISEIMFVQRADE